MQKIMVNKSGVKPNLKDGAKHTYSINEKSKVQMYQQKTVNPSTRKTISFTNITYGNIISGCKHKNHLRIENGNKNKDFPINL